MAMKGYVYGHQEVNNTWKTNYSITVTAICSIVASLESDISLVKQCNVALSDTFSSIFRGTKYTHICVSQEISFLFLQI